MGALTEAVERARAGGGPALLEFVLYRMTPHSSSDDPTRYQAGDWMARAQAHDPVMRLQGLLETLGGLSGAEKQRIEGEADREVRAAIDLAESTAPPVPESLTTDVWASRERSAVGG
jgi:TPP-dependent pyruvate/acetoin dehydrogenase alpha subunit